MCSIIITKLKREEEKYFSLNLFLFEQALALNWFKIWKI